MQNTVSVDDGKWWSIYITVTLPNPRLEKRKTVTNLQTEHKHRQYTITLTILTIHTQIKQSKQTKPNIP